MAHPSVIDRFTILRPVGTGGMGTVYEAIDPTIDRRVAIKLLHHDVLVQNPEVIERLWIEARAANRIGHAGVVQVSEAGKLTDGTGYLVMEFLEGQTLRQRLQPVGAALPLREALQVAIQIASTLNAGHQKGIVHRDLKPDNVMLVPDDAVASGERVKLLDFGIAKIAAPLNSAGPAGQTGAVLTVGDMGLGTPGYMAPEQLCDAARATDRTDVYALGAVLFELLAGRRPYVAPSTAELLVRVMSEDAPLITELLPEVSPLLAQLIASMLVRSPADQRPPMADVLRDLLLLSGVASGRRPLPPLDHATEGVQSTQTPSGTGERGVRPAPPTPPATQGKRWRSVAAVTLLACIGGVAALAVWRKPTGTKPLAGPPSVAVWKPDPALPQQMAPLPPPTHEQASEPTTSKPTPPAPPIAEPPPPTPAPAGPKLAATPMPPLKPPRQAPRIAVGAACLPALPSFLRGAVAQAALGAGLELAPNQSLELIRQGDHHFVFANAHVDGVAARTRTDFEKILYTALKDIALPPNIRKIPIRCHAK